MEKGYLNINEVDVDHVVARLNRSVMNTGGVGSEMPQSFSSLKNAKLFSTGVTKINNQIGAISKGISNVKTIFQKSIAKMNDAETSLSQRAESIYVPRDFIINDTTALHTIDDIVLNETINDNIKGGQALEIKELILDKNSVASSEFINILNNDGNINNVKIEEFNITKENLSDISNGEQMNVETLNFKSDLRKKELSNIENMEEIVINNLEFNPIKSNAKLKKLDSSVNEVKTLNFKGDIEKYKLYDANNSERILPNYPEAEKVVDNEMFK